MARPYKREQSHDTLQPIVVERSDYSAARMLAAAATALLVSLLVVSSTKDALDTERAAGAGPQRPADGKAWVEHENPPNPERKESIDGREPADEGSTDKRSQSTDEFMEPEVRLTDDDEGASMFESRKLASGVPAVECIAVSYRGRTPAVVRLFGVSYGPLAGRLRMRIERGAGGGFGDCRGFAPEKLIYRGTLSDFTRRYRSADVGLETLVARASPTTSTFKFTVSMDDQDATPGESASADFVWHSSR